MMLSSVSIKRIQQLKSYPSINRLSKHLYHSTNARFTEQNTSSEILSLESHPTIPGTCKLTLSNSLKRNALSKSLVEELFKVLEECHHDSSIRCMIINSSVKGIFCAGADLKERRDMSNEQVSVFVSSLRELTDKISKLPFPTIAAIEGVALGGGFEIALACDIRVTSNDALVGLPETGLGVIPGAGGTQRLPRLVGPSKAKELLFTGERLLASDAFRLGLVNYCVPSGEAMMKAEELAAVICEKAPIAIRMSKLAVDKGTQVDIDGSMEIEKLCYDEIIPTADRLEGLNAFMEKRKPVYKGE